MRDISHEHVVCVISMTVLQLSHGQSGVSAADISIHQFVRKFYQLAAVCIYHSNQNYFLNLKRTVALLAHGGRYQVAGFD